MDVLFSWVHLSDIHAGHGSAEQRHDQKLILGRLVTDVGRKVKELDLRPDALLVTGDIAFSGNVRTTEGEARSREYDTAHAWLAEIAEAAGSSLDAVFTVPGNHDIARTRKGMPLHVLRGLREGHQEIDDGLAEDDIRAMLASRLANYHEFCKRLNPTCSQLEGWVAHLTARAGLAVRLVGLNTALLCNDEHDLGKLRLGKKQLRHLAEPPHRDDELVIVLSHHPLQGEWLHDEREARSWVENHARIHLSGHVHEQDSSRRRRGGAKDPHVRIDAGAVHEERRPHDVPHSHGYNIAAVVRCDDGHLEVRIWPRRWSAAKTSFDLDAERVDEPNDHARHDLGLHCPTGSAGFAAPSRRECLPAPEPRDTAVDTSEEEYRAAVVRRFVKLPIRLRSVDPVELALEEVYVDLKVIADIPAGADTFSADERRLLAEFDNAEGTSRLEMQRQFDELRYQRWRRPDVGPGRPPHSILERAAGSSKPLIILGDPGSGKSTLLHLMALRAARDGRLSPTSQGSASKRLLPIFVPLAAYDEHLEKSAHVSLEQFFAIYGDGWEGNPGRNTIFQRALDEGRALVLLDGLDEVLTTMRRSHIVKQVEAFIRARSAAGNHIAITSRVIGYREAPLSGELDHVTMIDFGTVEIESFLTSWCEALERWTSRGAHDSSLSARAAKEKQAILAEIERAPHVRALAGNPMKLSMLAVLHRQGGRLPNRRAELYREFVTFLLDRRPELRSEGVRKDPVERFDATEARAHLADLALWLQQHRPSGTASREDLLRALAQSFLRFDAGDAANPKPKERIEAEQHAIKLLDELRLTAGLIAARGHDAYGFLHLTYQEFFAGWALARTTPDERWELLRRNLHRPRWRETLLFSAGCLGVLNDHTAQVDDLVCRVLDARSEHEALLHRDVFLASAMVTEDVRVSRLVLDRVHATLDALRSDPVPAVARRALTELAGLARLGHEPSIDLLLRMIEHPSSSGVYSVVADILTLPTCKRLYEAVKARFHGGSIPALFSLQKAVRKDEHLRASLLTMMSSKAERDRLTHLIPHLFSDLVDDFADVRRALISQLGDKGTRQPAAFMLARHKKDSAEIRSSLEPCWNDAPNDTMRPALFPAVIRWARGDASWRAQIVGDIGSIHHNTRHQAVYALGSLADFPEVRTALVDCLDNPQVSMAQSAVDALTPVVRVDADVRHVMIRMLGHRDPGVRQHAIAALGPVAAFHPEICDRLALCMTDDIEGVRHTAMRALAPMAAEQARFRDLFVHRLDEIRTCPKGHLIDTIAPLVTLDQGVNAEVSACLDHTDPGARAAAIAALAPTVSSNGALVNRIISKLDDYDHSVRTAAIDALAPVASSNDAAHVALLEVAQSAAEWVASRAIHALAPTAGDPTTRATLLRLFDTGQPQARIASAKALLPFLAQDSGIRARLQSLAVSFMTSSVADTRTSAAILGDAVERDDTIRVLMRDMTSKSSPMRFHQLEFVCEHSEVMDARQLVEALSKSADSHMRALAVRGLIPWMDASSRVRDLVYAECRRGAFTSPFSPNNAILHRMATDVALRKVLTDLVIEADDTSRTSIDTMRDLLPHVELFPDVAQSFRQAFERPCSASHGFGHARRCLGAAGLSYLVDRDANLWNQIIPWVGAQMPLTEPATEGTRGILARNLAPLVHKEPTLHDRLVEMLDSSAWQDRQGAAWTLMYARADHAPEIAKKLRGLLSDRRADESWSERLIAADALLNHVDPDLSRRAIGVASRALDHGGEPWVRPLGDTIRSQAAGTLGTLEPTYQDPILISRLCQALAEEGAEDVRDSIYQAILHLASAAERPRE